MPYLNETAIATSDRGVSASPEVARRRVASRDFPDRIDEEGAKGALAVDQATKRLPPGSFSDPHGREGIDGRCCSGSGRPRARRSRDGNGAEEGKESHVAA